MRVSTLVGSSLVAFLLWGIVGWIGWITWEVVNTRIEADATANASNQVINYLQKGTITNATPTSTNTKAAR